MKIKRKLSERAFQVFDVIFLFCIMAVCLLPFVHLLSVSLSAKTAVMTGTVWFWPKDFTFEAYRFLYEKPEFLRSFGVAVERVILGTVVNMLLLVLTAYPLSKETSRFRMRNVYSWIFVATMFFNGGMIPTYMLVKNLNLLDSIWALILPGALNVWNMVLLLNFFRQVPKELEEAGLMDGAGQMGILFRIYLPVSLPALATVLLFTIVGHWNAWFDGILYINNPQKYPLQTYLATIVQDANMSSMRQLTEEKLQQLQVLSDKSIRIAQIFLGALPIMLVYPFLQRYFVKGIVVGSVKG